jgi:hypothetical protein
VVELPKMSGRAFDPTADALCSGCKSSESRRRRLLGLTLRCTNMAVNWFTLVGSEVARLRLSNPRSSSAGGVRGSFSSQDEICVILSLVVEHDSSGNVIMTTCAAGVVVEVAWFAKIGLIVIIVWQWQRDRPLNALPSWT